MSKFQFLRPLVAELNKLEGCLFLANVTMPSWRMPKSRRVRGMQ
jgi:hypothetical protein